MSLRRVCLDGYLYTLITEQEEFEYQGVFHPQ